jgi:hypothetical protein
VRQPLETLLALREQGFELTRVEIDALIQTESRWWNSAAERIHPRLQRCALKCE